jgi:ATP-dependent Clp protease adapter protein ClpS
MAVVILLYSSLLFSILIHEIGHLLAVIFNKYRLVEFAVGPIRVKYSGKGYSIRPRASLFTGIVQYARIHGQATWNREIAIISAGIIANFAIGITLVIYFHAASDNGLIAIAGWTSVIFGLMNSFPAHIKSLGLDNDAKRLVGIFTFKKQMSQLQKYGLGKPLAQVEFHVLSDATAGKVQLEFLNDDSTPYDFVVDIFMTLFNFNDLSAALLMSAIHNDGIVQLGWLDQETAHVVSEQINNESRIRDFTFQCRVLAGSP